MASLFTRSRPQRPICELCIRHLPARRKPAPGSFRFFSAATRPVTTRRSLDRERTSLSSTQTGLRKYSPAPATSQTAEPDPKSAAENNKKGVFFTQASIQPGAPPAAECARLTNRRLVALSGPDAAKFLQGLITNNVDPTRTTPFYAAFLDARGRMLHDVFIWTYPDLHRQKSMSGTHGMGDWACYIDVEETEVAALVKHLKRHKLRSKVNITVVEENSTMEDTFDNLQVWAIWSGHEAINGSYESVATLKDPRFISSHMTMRRSLVRPSRTRNGKSPENLEGLEGALLEEYTRLRYSFGVIEGDEIPKETHPLNKGSALPMEYNVDISQGIDFKKGCYVGQELTIRTKHTGVVRKRILPVGLSNADAPSIESDPPNQVPTFDRRKPENFNLNPSQFESNDIKQLDENGKIKKGRPAGKLISAAGNLGLALCRLEMMTPMKVSAEGGTWKPGMEFGMEDNNGNIVKVKPFVREEWVARVRDIWDKKRERI